MNNPFTTKFAQQVGDITLSNVETSRTFQLLKGSQLILKEVYNYDAERNITIGGLADVISQAVYGTLTVGVQLNAKATFTCKLTGEEDVSATIYAQRLLNMRDPGGQKLVLAAAPNGVCYPGRQQLVTVIGQATVGLTGTSRTTTIGTPNMVATVDCDPQVLFSEHWQEGTALNIGSELLLKIVKEPCDEAVSVRFLNRYDMPETLVARYLSEKPSARDDVSNMNGRRTRFSVESSTDYSLMSGPLHHQDEYDTWQDLLTSRRAQILWHGTWVDIVVTKANYQHRRQQHYGSQIEITFQTVRSNTVL